MRHYQNKNSKKEYQKNDVPINGYCNVGISMKKAFVSFLYVRNRVVNWEVLFRCTLNKEGALKKV